jgi:hypothetical protein
MESQEIQNIESQCKQIIRHLLNGGTLTSLQALRMFGCLNLKGRIFDLRKQGFDIKTDMVQRGKKRVALYSLKK